MQLGHLLGNLHHLNLRSLLFLCLVSLGCRNSGDPSSSATHSNGICHEITPNDTIPSECITYMEGQCGSSEHETRYYGILMKYNDSLQNLTSAIEDRNCNCKNQTFQFFCRFLLPTCSNSSDDCSNSPRNGLMFPCKDYCEVLTNKCFTTNEINELSQLLMNDLQIVDNALYQNYTINETCAGLNNTMCWKDDSYNLSDCILPLSTLTTTSTVNSATTNYNTTPPLNIILFPVLAGLILICVIGVAIYCHRQNVNSKPANNHLNGTSNADDREIVDNALYQPIETKTQYKETKMLDKPAEPDEGTIVYAQVNKQKNK